MYLLYIVSCIIIYNRIIAFGVFSQLIQRAWHTSRFVHTKFVSLNEDEPNQMYPFTHVGVVKSRVASPFYIDPICNLILDVNTYGE